METLGRLRPTFSDAKGAISRLRWVSSKKTVVFERTKYGTDPEL